MNADEIVKKAHEEFAKLNKTPVSSVTGCSKTDDGWLVLLEAVERKAIPDTMDVLGLYEIRMDKEGNLLGFDRKKLRKRGDTKED
jgi:hypothetical protein